jgi:hypothetical protein
MKDYDLYIIEDIDEDVDPEQMYDDIAERDETTNPENPWFDPAYARHLIAVDPSFFTPRELAVLADHFKLTAGERLEALRLRLSTKRNS